MDFKMNFQTAKNFFCLEGIDGCGKSTQLKKIALDLENAGYEVLCIREPGGVEISEKIRQLLLDVKYKGIMCDKTELLLYNAARSQLIAEKIAPALAKGKVVLADRFAWSTLAYQGYSRGIDPQTILELSQIACGEYTPELTIVLDLSVEESRRRQAGEGRTPDRLESEAADFFERVRNGYQQMAKNFPACVSLIYAEDSVENVYTQIKQRIFEKLKR